MTDEEYEQLVVAECKDPESVDSGILYEDLDRWNDTLFTLIDEVDEQLAIKQADVDQAKVDTFPQDTDDDEKIMLEAEAKFSMWAARSKKYRRHLVDRMKAVGKLISERDGVEEAVESSKERVLTEVRRICKLGEGTKELQEGFLQLEVAYEMRAKREE